MSKLKCSCGNVIVDQTDNLAYKGNILPDQSDEDLFDVLTAAIDSLEKANDGGKRLDWIKSNFSVPPYPTDLSDSAMIHDIFSSAHIDATRDIYQCEDCGCLLLQSLEDPSRFISFKPDGENFRGILEKGG